MERDKSTEENIISALEGHKVMTPCRRDPKLQIKA